MSSILDKLEWIEETVMAYLLAAMVVLSFANVIDRRFLSGGIFWAQEATLFCFLILVMLGMTYALRKTLHIGVDALVVLMSKKWERICTLVTCGFTMLYATLIIWGSYVAFSKFYFHKVLSKAGMNDIDIKKWQIYALMAACFIYFLITMFYLTYAVFTGKRHTITAAHEAAEDEEAAVKEAAQLREDT